MIIFKKQHQLCCAVLTNLQKGVSQLTQSHPIQSMDGSNPCPTLDHMAVVPWDYESNRRPGEKYWGV